jgi:hypothetical protein
LPGSCPAFAKPEHDLDSVAPTTGQIGPIPRVAGGPATSGCRRSQPSCAACREAGFPEAPTTMRPRHPGWAIPLNTVMASAEHPARYQPARDARTCDFSPKRPWRDSGVSGSRVTACRCAGWQSLRRRGHGDHPERRGAVGRRTAHVVRDRTRPTSSRGQAWVQLLTRPSGRTCATIRTCTRHGSQVQRVTWTPPARGTRWRSDYTPSALAAAERHADPDGVVRHRRVDRAGTA